MGLAVMIRFNCSNRPCHRSQHARSAAPNTGNAKCPWLTECQNCTSFVFLLLTVAIMSLSVPQAQAQTPVITLSVPANTQVAEDGGNTTVTVTATLATASSSNTVVDLSLSGSTKSSDYTVVTLPDITIPSGETTASASLTLSPVDDIFYEGEETVTIGGSASGFSVTGVDVPFLDNDARPTLRVTFRKTGSTSNWVYVEEGDSVNIEGTVTLVGGSRFESDVTGTVAMHYGRSGMTFVSAGDFDFSKNAPPWSFTIPAEGLSATFQITVKTADDAVEENEEQSNVKVTVAPFAGVQIETVQQFLRIGASDLKTKFWMSCLDRPRYAGTTTSKCQALVYGPTPSKDYTIVATPHDSSLINPDSISFTVKSGQRKSAVKSVQFVVADAAKGKRIEFKHAITPNDNGEAESQSVSFSIFPDFDSDNLEPAISQGGSPKATYLLGDNAFSVSFVFPYPITLTGTKTLTVELDSGEALAQCETSSNSGQIDCNYRVKSGDYDFDGVVVVPIGAANFTGWCSQNDENDCVTLTGAFPKQETRVTIHTSGQDNYGLIYGGTSAINLSVTPQSVQEGTGEHKLTVRAQNVTGTTATTDIEIPLTFADISTDSNDYKLRGELTVTIPANKTEGSNSKIYLTPTEDLKKESRIEKLRIEGSKGASMTPFVRGTELRILDAAGIRLSASPAVIAENGSATSVTVTASWADSGDSPLTEDLTIPLTRGGSASANDYSYSGATSVTIKANSRSGSASVTITPTDDKLLEGDESIALIGTLPGRTVAPSEISIQDDETEPAVTLVAKPNSVHESNGAQTVTVSATLDPDIALANEVTTVTLNLGGTATPNIDYSSTWSPTDKQISIPVNTTEGANSVDLTITPIDDDIGEASETIVVEGTATTGSRNLVVEVAEITLEDSDTRAVNISPSKLTVNEGGAETYEVWLGTKPDGDVTVSLSSSDATIAAVSKSQLTFSETTWKTKQTVTVNGVEDDRNNIDNKRSATITHTAGGGGYDGVEAVRLPVDVRDNEDATSFSIADSTAVEGQPVSFTVTRTDALGDAASVKWSTMADGSAGSSPASAADYSVQATAQTLNFAASESSKTITVATTEDVLHEGDETFLVKLSAPSEGALITDDTATGTIADDDAAPGTLTLSVDADKDTDGNQDSVSEGGGAKTMRVTATLGGTTRFSADKEVTVAVGKASDSAAEGTDYATVADQTITILAGAASGHVDVALTPVADALHESDETISIEGTLAGVTVTHTSVKIADDDAMPTVTLVLSPTEINESGSTSSSAVTAKMNGTSGDAVTLTVSSVPVNPAVASDYAQSGSTLTIAAGATVSSGTVKITAVDNKVDAPDKTVTVSAVASGGNGVSNPANVTLTIADDDSVGITLSRESVTLQEVDNEQTSDDKEHERTYTIKLDSQPSAKVTVSVTSDDATKATVNPSSVEFETGNWSEPQTITVTSVDDTLDNAGDKRTTGISHAVIAAGKDYENEDVADVEVTVVDNEGTAVVTLVLDPETINESGSANSSAVTAKMNGTSGQAVTLTVSSAPVDPATADDYTQTGSTLTIAAGAKVSSGTVKITAVDNKVDAPDKTVTISAVSAGGNGVSNPANVTLTIADDDAAPGTLTLSVDADKDKDGRQDSVSEGDGAKTMRVTATLGGTTRFAVDKEVTVTVGKASDSAAEGTDYATVADRTITIAAGAASGHVDVALTPTADALHESDETISIEGTLTDVTVTHTSVKITDDDAAPGTLALSVDADKDTDGMQDSVSEDGGTKIMRVTATLGGATRFSVDKEVMVAVGKASDSAAEGTDYATVPEQTITIAAGAASGHADVALTPKNDAIYEGEETISIEGTLTGVTVTHTSVKIADDEALPILSVESPEVAEGDSGSKSLVFALTLSSGSSQRVTVNYADSGTGTATSGTDYAKLESGTVVFEPNILTKAITIKINGDTLTESDETVAVRFTGPVNARFKGGNNSLDVIGTIKNDDSKVVPEISIADARGMEGAVLIFQISLSELSPGDVAVDWRTRPDTAEESVDYEGGRGALEFAAGERTKTLRIQTIDDEIDEPTEFFFVELSGSKNATIQRARATGSIMNEDGLPHVWNSRFGRTVAEQLLDGIESRISSEHRPGLYGTFAGVPLIETDQHRTDFWGRCHNSGSKLENAGKFGLRADYGCNESDFGRRSLDSTEILTGTRLSLTDKMHDDSTVALWFRGAQSSFDGFQSGLTLDGTVSTGMIGVDWTKDDWRGGLVLSLSDGKGGYSSIRDKSGAIRSKITAIAPWIAFHPTDQVILWSTAGYGSGELAIKPENTSSREVDLDWSMTAVGSRGAIIEAPSSGGFGLDFSADALWVRTSSDRSDNIVASESEISRLQLGLQSNWTTVYEDASVLKRKLEVGIRRDKGDAEAGTGIEIGAGISWTQPNSGIEISVEGSALVAHSDNQFKNWAAAGEFSYAADTSSERGLSFKLRQQLGGRVSNGFDALFGNGALDSKYNEDELDSRRLEAEIAYGYDIPYAPLIGSPYLGHAHDGSSYSHSLGLRLAPLRRKVSDITLDTHILRLKKDNLNARYKFEFQLRSSW